MIFRICWLSVPRGNLSNSNKLKSEFLVPKTLPQGRKVDATLDILNMNEEPSFQWLAFPYLFKFDLSKAY